MRHGLAWGIGLALLAARPAIAQQPTDTIAITTHEGTGLSFDLSRDGRTITFDLLGQIWTLDAAGGEARAITDGARDIAEDLDPALSPDGTRVAFSAERGGRRGLWVVDLAGGAPSLVSATRFADGFDGQPAWSPDGRTIAFTRAVVEAQGEEARGWTEIALLDVTSGETRTLAIEGLAEPDVRDPAWSPDGMRIAFVDTWAQNADGGRVWSVPAAGGTATPLSPEGVGAVAPAFSPDGASLAFLAPDSAGRPEVWILESAGGTPRRLTDDEDVARTRVRWTPEGSALLYSAEGRLWRMPVLGGAPAEVPFVASLSFTRPRVELPPARFPAPGVEVPARGHMGLALAPGGGVIGALALGRLWVVPIEGDPPAFGAPRAVAEVPPTAVGLAWSPDEAEVAYAAGPLGSEDLYAMRIETGEVRRVTALEGGEREPLWSPDGARIAFVHATDEGFRLRVVDASASDVTSVDATSDRGGIPSTWVGETADAPVWSPDGRGILIRLRPHPVTGTRADLAPLEGERRRLERFVDAPVFLLWPSQDAIVFTRHDRLWAADFDTLRGAIGDPRPLSDAAAIYPSAARDGTLLFLSGAGWRLRRPSGEEHTLGWPLSYTPPVAAPLLIRNVRLIDGTGAPATEARDVLVREGRIARIAPTGAIEEPDARVLDAEGRTAIPGLMDLHMHGYDPAGLPSRLYYGVTTIRDQGSRVITLVGMAEAMAAGVVPGPRVSYGGFQFFTDWPYDGEEWRGIEPESDPGHVERAVALAEALGAHHVKTRTFRRWDINARILESAHRRGLRGTGHCAHPLPLVVAHMDAQEHIRFCNARGNPFMYEDILQLYRAAGISVVPTILYSELPVRVSRDQAILLDEGFDPWDSIPAPPWMLGIPSEERARMETSVARDREMVARLRSAGIRIGLGTDVWELPWGAHLELEELVRSGLTPLEAIHAATGASAEIVGAEAELGTLEEGKWADLVLLDADPLADIRNTRRIHTVVKGGEIVDRLAIREFARRQSGP